MGFLPHRSWREHVEPDEIHDPLRGLALREQRAVQVVVEQREDPQLRQAGDDRGGDRNPERRPEHQPDARAVDGERAQQVEPGRRRILGLEGQCCGEKRLAHARCGHAPKTVPHIRE